MSLRSDFFHLVALVRKHLYLYLIAFIAVSISVSSFLILGFEADYADSQIKTMDDAVWWSAVGVSTIGIGNIVPESTSGRYLTLYLTIVGVIIFSVITAKIAAVFTEEEVKEDLDKNLKEIQGDLSKVEHDIEGEVAVDDRKIESKLKKIESRMQDIEKKGNKF